MSSRLDLIQIYRLDVQESLLALIHSYEKLRARTLPPLAEKGLDQLEPWEALTSRFARVTDIFLSKYIRFVILDQDPGFRGEMRDYMDKAEKGHFISSADSWMKIRELRNKIAHEYSREDLQKTFQDILALIPFVLNELKGFKS